jgi:hypothetical protein
VRAGAAISGADVLARHVYAASATWLVDAPPDAARPAVVAPDWHLGYAYDRWRPTLFVSASSETAFGAGRPDSAGRPTSATLRSASIEAGVLFPVRHVRVTHRASASLLRTVDRYTLTDRVDSRTRTAARLAWATTTARTFGYSISPERGVSIGSTAELSDEAGSSAGTTTVTTDARAYLRGLAPHHVVALRGAAGVSQGNQNAERIFHLGGPMAGTDVVDFGRGAISLLRGFPADAFAGTRVALLNSDYRFPIARPQRGVGTVPVLLHTVHAAVFADAGHAWTRRFNLRDVKVAAGAELSFDLVVAYTVPLTVSAGAGWGRDGADRSSGRAVYVRVGHAF